jgi:hypothetical protein
MISHAARTGRRHHWRSPSTSRHDSLRPIPFASEELHRGPTSNRILSSKYRDESGLQYYGHRHFTPGLGGWLSRDTIGDLAVQSPAFRIDLPFRAVTFGQGRPGQLLLGLHIPLRSELLNLQVFGLNDPVGRIDPQGLSTIGPTYRNWRRVREECTCGDIELNKCGHAASQEARNRSTLERPWLGGLWGPQKYEFCGRLCCDKNTLDVKRTGPVRGPMTIVRLPTGALQLSKSCDARAAPECSTLNTGTTDYKTAGWYHSHPEGTFGFSAGDLNWSHTAGRGDGYPFFLGEVDGGKIRRLDPYLVEATIPLSGGGFATIPDYPWAKTYMINAGGSSVEYTQPSFP